MADTPLTEAELKKIEGYMSTAPDTVRVLVAEIRRLRADLVIMTQGRDICYEKWKAARADLDQAYLVRDQARAENMEQIKAARVVARLAGIQEGFDIAAPEALKESERALADAEHRLREIYKVTLQKRDNEGVWLRTIQGLAEESRRATEEGGK